MAKLLLTPLGLGRGVGGVRARQSICASRPVHCRPRGCVGRTPLRSGRQSLTTLAQLPGDRGDEHRRALGTTEDLVKQLEAPASQERVEGLAKAPAFAGLPNLSKAMLAGGGGLMAATGFSLDGPWSVVQALGVVCFIIFGHECGHFFAARLQGIHVSKFSVGFGPKIAYKGPEVEYSLGLIPLGGFVEFPNGTEEGPVTYPPDDRDLLNNRPVPQRLIVASAGVLANMVLAFGLLTTQVSTVGKIVQDYQPGVMVPAIKPDSAAMRAGIKVGDIIRAVDGQQVEASKASVTTVVDRIFGSRGETLTFLIERPGVPEPLTIAVTPDVASNGQGRLGVTLQAMSNVRHEVTSNFGEAVVAAAQETGRLTGLVLQSFQQLFSNFQDSLSSLSGPVAVLAMGAEVARGDPAGLYQFAAVVSINLAIVNILPLPALDGGYIVLLGLEAVRGKKLPQEVETAIQSSGFLLLTSSALLIFIQDTMKLDFVSKLFE